MVRRFIFLMAMGVMTSACSGSGTCSPPTLRAGDGTTACSTAKAYVTCTDPGGGGCACLSNDPSTCSACGSLSGLTCHNVCASDEYAVSCGGLPGGGPYQSVPSNCHAAATTPGGNTFACCPCS